MIALAPVEFIHPKTPIEFLGWLIVLVIGPLLLIGFSLHKRQALHDLLTEGLYLLTGRMGAGKSYFMTVVIAEALKEKRLVFANYELKGQISWKRWSQLDDPLHYEGIVHIDNWTQARTAPTKTVIVIDEAQNWWGANDWNAPIEQREWITRLRKLEITLIASAQDIDFLAKWLRKLAFGVWEGSRFRTGHLYRLFDVSEAGRTSSKRKPQLQVILKRKRSIMAMYDTKELVSSSREWGGVEEPVVPSRPSS